MGATNFLAKIVIVVVFHTLGIVHVESSIRPFRNVTAIGRNARQFYPFFPVGVVRFENGICTGSGSLEGTCFTRRQCATVDGIGSTSCANGIGVCCVIQRTCGESSQLNNTYFASPGYPSVYTSSSVCSYTIRKIDSSICQVRIDFLTMRLAQPDANGTCTTDALIVTGGASNLPVLCGDNTGQHMYVDFNGNSSIVISISSSGTFTATAWNIKVAQIACNCPYRAPSGCLQYYNTTTGTVTSFNYGSAAPQNGTRQLANLNYGVCVATMRGYCGIQWSQSGTLTFSVSDNTYTYIGDGTIGTAAAQMTGVSCTTDFVVIPGATATDGTALTTDRFCGNGFVTIQTYSQPFVLTVVTNGDETAEMGNVGFSLDFSQLTCGLNIFVG